MAVEAPNYVYGNNLGRDNTGMQVSELKVFRVMADNTADAADTIAVNLSQHGITTFWGVLGWKETTDGSVIVAEQPTTAVSVGVLTLTIPAGTDNDPRTYEIYGV